MPNQRKKGKLLVSGWVDAEIKGEIKHSGMTDTSFTELVLVRELLKLRRISAGRVVELGKAGRVGESTISELTKENLLPAENNGTVASGVRRICANDFSKCARWPG